MTVSPAPPALPRRLAFVDLETTGAAGPNDRVTEIGIVRVGPEGVREWSSLVNPQVPISSFIEQLTGISNAMVARAPPFSALVNEVRAQLDGHLFIAHNARFDYGFVRSEFARLGERFRAPLLCTVRLSRRLYPQQHRHNLDALIERHGINIAARHRALGDAQAIHAFWQQHLNDEADRARLAVAVDDLIGATNLPAHLDMQLDDDLPEGRGVYRFLDADGQVICLARAKALKSRVLSYFSRGKPPGALKAALAARVARIECYAAADEAEAILIEANLRRGVFPKELP